ncbi:MAG: putative Ig domain-containing protein [Candidatus Thiodiazotropha endolucinida]
MLRKGNYGLCIFIVAALFSLDVFAASLSLLENTTFIRDKGTPKVETIQFDGQPGSQFQLTLYNGGVDNQYCRITSAVILLNDQPVFSPNDFKQKTHQLTQAVDILQINSLSVELRSKPGCAIEINVEGEPPVPTLSITSTPPVDTISGQVYRYQITTSPEVDWGQLAVNFETAPVDMTISEGLIEWMPTDQDEGQHPVSLDISHPDYGVASQAFSIDVLNPNYAPVANDLAVELAEDTSTAFSLPASDLDADALTFIVITPPQNGHLTLLDGEATYVPVEDFFGSDQFEYQANDGEFNSNIATVTITVAAQNDAPQIISDPNTVAAENTLYTYQVESLDVDGDIVTLQLDLFPAGMTLDPQSGLISWTPTGNQLGQHNVSVSAIDPQGLTDTQSFSIDVVNVNDPPTITSSANTSVNEREEYLYLVTATDPDAGDTLTFSLDVAPVGMSVDIQGGQISWSPQSDHIGSHAVTLVVTDAGGLSDTQNFTVTVHNVEDAPVITSTAVVTATEDMPYSYDVEAVDPDDGDSLTFALPVAPTGMTIDSTSGVISWTPLSNQTDDHLVSVTVTDSTGLTATQDFTLNVVNVNDAPEILSTPVTTARELEDYAYQLEVIDRDNDPVTYEIVVAPDGMTMSNSGLVSWTPALGQAGSHPVTLRVSDTNAASVEQSYIIAVDVVANTAPIASDTTLTVAEDTSISFLLTATDPDNDLLTYEVLSQPVSGSLGGSAPDLIYTPNANFHGVDTFTFKANDGIFDSNTATVSITVSSVNDAPVITSLPVTGATSLIAYQYQVVAEDVDVGDSLTFALTQAPAGMTISSTGVIEWQPPWNADPSNSVSLVVSDSVGAEATQTYVITLTNRQPAITTSPTTTTTEGETYTYDVDASDPDGDTLSYSLSTAPQGMTIDGVSGLIQWIPDNQQLGDHLIEVMVADTGGLSDTQSFTLVVAGLNAAPVITSAPVITATESALYHYAVEAVDPDGDPISYALLSAPSGMAIDPQTGLISWVPDGPQSFGNLIPNEYCRLPATSAQQRPRAMDAVMVVDGSGSNEATWPWVAGAMASLNADLKSIGIGADPEENRFGLVGFGTRPAARLFDGNQFTTVSNLYEATYDGISPGGDGTAENGLRALQFTIDTYQFRDDVVKNLIWIPDEPQQGTLENNETLEVFTQRLIDTNFNVNVVTPFTIECLDGRRALGIDADGRGYVSDDNEEFEYCELDRTPIDQGSGYEFTSYIEPFVLTALATGGAAWDLNAITTLGQPNALRKALASRMYSTSTVNEAERGLADLAIQNLGLAESQIGAATVTVTLINRGRAQVDTPIVVNLLDTNNANAVIATQNLSSFSVDEERLVSFALDSASVPSRLGVSIETESGVECLIDNNQVDVPVIVVSATDNQGNSDNQLFTIAVQDFNQAPVINSNPELQAYVGQPYTYQVTFDDPDSGDDHQFSVSNSLTAVIDQDSGLFTYTPNADDLGDQSFTVSVTDLSSASDSQTFTLNVSGDYLLPRFDGPPVGNRAIIGQAYEFTPSVTADPTAVLGFSLLEMPSGMTIDAQNGTIHWVATDADLNRLRLVTMGVADQYGNKDLLSFMLFGDYENQTPVITTTPNEIAQLRSNYNYSVRYDDPNVREDFDLLFDTTVPNLTGYIPQTHGLDHLYGNLTWDRDDVTSTYPRHMIDSDFLCLDPTVDHPSAGVLHSNHWSIRGDRVGRHLLAVPVTDTNGDGAINSQDRNAILYTSWFGSSTFLNAVDSATGEPIWTQEFVGSEVSISRSHAPAVADVNADGVPDIILVEQFSRLLLAISSDDRRELWKSTVPIADNGFSAGQITLTDLENDGAPEILAGFSIYDAQGNWIHSLQRPVNIPSGGDTSPIYPIDLDLDGSKELIQGGVAYSTTGSELWRVPFSDNHGSRLAYSAFANFDADPEPEIVHVERSDLDVSVATVSLLDSDGSFIWGPNDLQYVGQPIVGDLDGDGELEIFVSGEDVLLDHLGNTQWRLSGFNQWDNNITTAVDLQGNGRVEIVLTRNSNIRVLDALTGGEMTRIYSSNPSAYTKPLIVDMDGDGRLEFVSAGFRGIYQSSLEFDNHSLAIPRVIYQNWWQPQGLNDQLALNQNAPIPWSVNNTDQVVIPPQVSFNHGLPDIWVDAPRGDHRQSVNVQVTNRGTADYTAALDVELYAGDPLNGGQLLGSQSLSGLAIKEVQTLQFNDLVPVDFVGELVARAVPEAGVVECQTNNNMTSAYTVDLSIADHTGATDTQNYLLGVEYDTTYNYLTDPGTQSVVEGELLELDIDIQVTSYTDDNNSAFFHVDSAAPEGLTVDGSTGVVRWVPPYGSAGNHNVLVYAKHLTGYSQRYIGINVLPAANYPPEIISTPQTSAFVSQPFSYDVEATDSDGDTLSYSLIQSPTGMSIDANSGLIQWTPDVQGTFPVTVTVSDGTLQTVQDFNIAVVASNVAPVIISMPSGSAIFDQLYSYDVDATDSDGDPLTYLLVASPAGMTIDSATGIINWTPQVSQGGTHTIEIRVEDGRGGAAIQTYGLYASDGAASNELPTIQSQPGFSARINQSYSYQVVATDPDGDTLSYSLIEGPAGMTLSNTGLVAWTPDSEQSAPVRVRVGDGTGYVEQSWTITVLPESADLAVILYIQPATVAEGETVTLQVIPQNAIQPVSLSLTVDGTPVALDNTNSAQLTASGVGSHTVVATVSDQYDTVTDTGSFLVNDPNSADAPVVTLLGPVEGSEITAPTPVLATITDDDLSVWELWLVPPTESTVDLSEATLLASGDTVLDNQEIAQFDPTLLLNGQHRLYLRAIDAGGNEGQDSVTLQVTGDMKLGHFRVTFKDLEVPVAGIPITITRTYDSRQRNRSLDFGHGWSVGYQDLFVQESRPPGYRWYLDSYSSGPLGLLMTYCVRSYDDNIVSVTLPDGKVERFKAVASPECNEVQPIFDVHVVFEPLDGTSSTLEATDLFSGRLVNNHIVDPGQPDAPIDPDRYRLTTAEDVVYDLVQGTGIRTLIVPTGEELTFGSDGITHSSGASVSFVRDAQGRIEQIVTPDGEILAYQYDATSGDLTAFTDQAAAISTYGYIADHYLQDIHDARGVRTLRNLYDNDGRLIGQIDAEGNRIDYAYDIVGRTQTVTDRRGNDRILVFNDRGDVVAETNALGETTLRSYDRFGNELSHTDPLGNTRQATYDARGNTLTETDPLGNTTTQTYSRYNQVETVTEPDGRVTSLTYRNYIRIAGVTVPRAGPITTITDAQGNVIDFAYDINGSLPVRITDPQGNETWYAYDMHGNKIRETKPDGSIIEFSYDTMGRVLTETRTRTDGAATLTEVTSHGYDAAGREISTTDPLGNITRTEYDEAGQVSAQIDALGNRTEYAYDDRGNQVLTRYADGTTETQAYDGENNLIEQSDRAGRITRMVYDAANRLIQTIHPDATPADDSDNPRSHSEYDAAGRLIAETDALGNRTEYAYDAAGQRTRTTDALGNVTRFEYDVHGNRTAMIDALNRRTEYVYDTADRLIETRYADASTTQATYDSLGRNTAQTDQAAISTQYAYDSEGRLTQATDALGGVTSYGYDEQGNKLTQTDAAGRTTSWTYDSAGNVLSRTLPMGQQESFAYDANGNLTGHTDFNGNATSHQYDSDNRLISSDYADGTLEVISYDAAGNRSQIDVTHPDGSQTTTLYSYDPNNRLETEVQPDGTVLTYQYDAAGNRTQVLVSLPDGSSRTTDYGYDSLNRLQSVTDASGATSYGYDAVGNRTSVSYPNGSSEVYAYDNLNRLTRKETYNGAGALIQAYNYTLHATGRRTGIDELSGRSTTYGYDDLYRLTSESITDSQNGDYSASYQYDGVGNRTYSTIDGVQTAYTYDANDRLTQQGGTRYTYDANGSTLTETLDTTTVTYGYNAKNELMSVTQNGVTTEYGYNPNGIRSSKTESGVITQYVVDENRDYAQVLIEDDGTNQVSYTYGDDLISQDRNGSAYYYHYDGLGSTRSLTDSLGNLANTYDYEAFGEVLGQTGGVENSYLFAGEQFDNTLDQYYLRARYYDQSAGRFASMDRWQGDTRSPITLNKYVYADANPANKIDPSGHMSAIRQVGAVSTIGILASMPMFSYQIGQSLAGGANSDGGFTSNQLGWLVIAGMVAQNSKLYDLISSRVSERDDSDDTVDLSRAVEDVELASMYSCNCFSLGPNVFPKQFFHTDAEAIAFGNQFIMGISQQPWFHLVNATISRTMYNSLSHDASEPGIGPIVTVPNGLLPAFNLEVNRNGGWRYSGTYP